MVNRDLPPPQGLYDPRFEHDSCGVGFVVDMQGRKSRHLVDQALAALCNLNHRGAAGAEPDTGDGAGVLVQIPDTLYRAVVPFELPAAGEYATGIAFLPPRGPRRGRNRGREGPRRRRLHRPRLARRADRCRCPGRERARSAARVPAGVRRQGRPRRRRPRTPRLHAARKRIEHATDAYFPSLSARVVVYKGMLTPSQVQAFYGDLQDPRFESALCLVHSRFSTNTFPTGRSRTRTACSPTTARSTRCRATRTGCARARA